MERYLVTVPIPVFVFGATPRDIIVAGFLTEFAQGSQAINNSQIISVDCDTEFMILMCCHVYSFLHLATCITSGANILARKAAAILAVW